MAFCGQCGAQIPDEAPFCSKCGAPQENAGQATTSFAESQPSISKAKGLGKLPLIIGVAVAAVIVLGVLIGLLSSR